MDCAKYNLSVANATIRLTPPTGIGSRITGASDFICIAARDRTKDWQ